MTLSKFILLGLLLLPAAEIAGFLVTAALIGVWAAVGALLAVSLLGAVVLRRAAGRQIAEFRRRVAGDPVKALDINASGSRGLGAGVLLLVPGFITGGLGLLLLLVPLRWYGGLFGRTLGPGSADEAGHSLVDLERNEMAGRGSTAGPRRGSKTAPPRSAMSSPSFLFKRLACVSHAFPQRRSRMRAGERS